MSADRQREERAPLLGHPRVHLRATDSTNARAKELALAGAPGGTLISADHQSAGRGRQGRSWWAPPGSSLLCSLILRTEAASPLAALRDEQGLELLPILAATALAQVLGPQAQIKWPNDVLYPRSDGRLGKVAGILIERRSPDRFAVLGIGVNVCASIEQAPLELRGEIATLARDQAAIEPLLQALLTALEAQLLAAPERALADFRARDALYGREIAWRTTAGASAPATRGLAQGIDGRGRLLVRSAEGMLALSSGEVHLCGDGRPAGGQPVLARGAGLGLAQDRAPDQGQRR
ncbi:MAG TPA: biotin--[acetyl-CoA-carboxylase] ligase [Solirubrobacteraceae bacterium]|nr:biotin--[acetyl-CoA-carboxylase] ligase [Solirubrobacteraceae bacterium]